MTDTGLLALAGGCTELTSINLDDCEEVTLTLSVTLTLTLTLTRSLTLAFTLTLPLTLALTQP